MRLIDEFVGKRLVILGLARQGKALARFASEQGAEVVVSDLGSAENHAKNIEELAHFNIDFVLGEHPLSLLDGTDYVAISGAVPADAPFVNAARARGITITNDSQEFLRRSPAPVVGITGSAGKSTTTSLLGEMCRASGTPTFVGGNLGFPLIERIGEISADSHVIQELSSFQLEIATLSPQIAAILNITPNHLDRHKTMQVYTDAKANILRNQSVKDTAILPADGLTALHSLVQGRLRLFSHTQPVGDGAFVRDNAIILTDGTAEVEICAVSDIQLLGRHNILNVLAAVVLADSVGISAENMRTAIRSFSGIPHRLELVATVNGVQYINDSIATAPERALAAIRAFDEPLVLLTGGRDKDLDWEPWAEQVQARCQAVILFGELAQMVSGKIDRSKMQVVETTTLEEAVAKAFSIAKRGNIVLLSPGGTSYDAYVDFAARGQHFREIVAALRSDNVAT